MREIDKKHIEETKNKKINEMVSEELADEDISAEEYEETKKEICREYGTDDDNYLVNGAVLVCDRATSDLVLVKGQPIILTSDIGADIRTKTNLRVSKNAAYDKEQKVATVKDRELIEDPQKDTDKNIRPFMCNCLNQPNDEEADEILRNREYYEKNGTCCKLIKLRDDWENMIRDTNYQTFSYGVDNRVEEVEGITMLSMLFCSHGGLITPIDSGQSSNEEIVLIYEADKQAKVSGLSGESGEGARKGVPVLFNFSTHEPGKFGSSTPNYYIMNHSNQYTDSDGLSRISKIPGEKANDDYYCVAMAPGFITRASNYCTPAEEGNINFGYRFLVRLCDKNGGNYDLNVIVVDEKNSEDRSDLYPHNNIVEFVTNNALSDDITEGGNVSFDKLLGGTELEIEEVYAYKEGAYVTGNYRDGGCRKDR